MPERNWKKRMRRRILIRSVILLVILAAAAVVGGIYWVRYRDAWSTMPSGEAMVLQDAGGGQATLSWPEAEKQDYYCVEILHQVEVENKKGEITQQWQVLGSLNVEGENACAVSDVPQDEPLLIRVNTMVGYRFLGRDFVRPGEQPLEMTVNMTPPAVEALQWKADPEQDIVSLEFTIRPGDKARLWWEDENGQWQLLRTIDQTQTTISFGEAGDLPMPAHEKGCRFRMDSFRELEGGTFYSLNTEPFTVIREDLLGRDLWVQLTDNGENVCSLIWNETKGDYYELQMKEHPEDDWTTICTVEKAGERSYSTEHLKAFRTYSFRVLAQGGQNMGNKPAASSEIVQFRTAEAVLFSTIWPIKELKVFTTPEMTEELGKVAGGTTLCVVEDHGEVFGVRWDDETIGYLDNRYVMINLPEYLGELCAYDITNSYASKYMINKYKIPYVTDTVIGGYEKIRLTDGSYLAPLLYPVAQRLLPAAQSAWDAGYRLKIYDSYRPNRATVMLYNKAEELLEEPVPGKIPNPTEEDPEHLLTYGDVMTDEGKYPLNYFLAQGASLHNLGIALDLTIEKLDTGEEQPMQTYMHDLSYYSMIYRNNQNAQLLKEFMEGAGFGGLVSEWWHFQDNDIRKELNLPALWGGVSAEGWKLSDGGWRYRLSDGSYASDCTLTIGEQEYAFDARGYRVETE